MLKKKSSNQTKACSINFFIKIIFILSILFLFDKKKNIKVALCTMGKQENLYVKEFISYYIRLGMDKIFIYDDNDNNTEQISYG